MYWVVYSIGMTDKQNIKEEDEEKTKKSFFKKWWKQVIASLAVFGAVWGILEGVYFFTQHWHEYQLLIKTVKKLNNGDNNFENRITYLENYLEKKNKSYAVGFRVTIVTDEETGRHIKKRTHRGWDGEERNVYKDAALSETNGVDYYFWVDEQGERNYVW